MVSCVWVCYDAYREEATGSNLPKEKRNRLARLDVLFSALVISILEGSVFFYRGLHVIIYYIISKKRSGQLM